MGQDFSGPTPGVTKIFTKGMFESARANNRGAARASTDILIFQDADIIFKLNCYQQIIEKIGEGYETVRIGQRCVNLNYRMASAISNNMAKLDQVTNTQFSDSIRDAPGACVALTRDAFVKVGGHCELFKFYGWEDCYTLYKLRKLTETTSLKEQMIHLPHEENFQIGKQAAHRKLYEELLYTDGGDCRKLSIRDRMALLKAYPVFAKGAK